MQTLITLLKKIRRVVGKIKSLRGKGKSGRSPADDESLRNLKKECNTMICEYEENAEVFNRDKLEKEIPRGMFTAYG